MFATELLRVGECWDEKLITCTRAQPGSQGRQPGEPEAGTLRAVTRQETRHWEAIIFGWLISHGGSHMVWTTCGCNCRGYSPPLTWMFIIIIIIIIIIVTHYWEVGGIRLEAGSGDSCLGTLSRPLGFELFSGWHYLSNATFLMRPHSFCALFVVSRITITCYIFRHAWRKPASDK